MVLSKGGKVGEMRGEERPSTGWTLHEAAKAIGLRFVGKNIPMPSHIFVDSRDVLPGSLFVALKGEKADGYSCHYDRRYEGRVA